MSSSLCCPQLQGHLCSLDYFSSQLAYFERGLFIRKSIHETTHFVTCHVFFFLFCIETYLQSLNDRKVTFRAICGLSPYQGHGWNPVSSPPPSFSSGLPSVKYLPYPACLSQCPSQKTVAQVCVGLFEGSDRERGPVSLSPVFLECRVGKRAHLLLNINHHSCLNTC